VNPPKCLLTAFIEILHAGGDAVSLQVAFKKVYSGEKEGG